MEPAPPTGARTGARKTTYVAHRLPQQRWVGTWVTAVLIAAALIGGWEAYWRHRGFVPQVVDRRDLWVMQRFSLRPNSTVAVGTSRILAALEPNTWAQETGGPAPVYLATPGGSTIRLLEHLGADAAFHGLVLGDIVPIYTFNQDSVPDTEVDLRIEAYEKAVRSPALRSEAYLRTSLTRFLVTRQDMLEPPALVRRLRSRSVPQPLAVRPRLNGYAPQVFRSRGIPPDEPRILDPRTFEGIPTRAPDAGTFQRQLARLSAAVDRIRLHGGHVILIHMPGCRGSRQFEERLFPKAVYWDSVLARVHVPAIDMDEYSGGRLECWDGSHVDATEAGAVSRWLVSQVRQRLAGAPASNGQP